MKRFYALAAALLLGSSLRSQASAKMDPAPPVEESTPEADKAAVEAASNDADQWAAKNKAEEEKRKSEEEKKRRSEEEKQRSSEEVKKGSSEETKKGESEEEKKGTSAAAISPESNPPSLPPSVPASSPAPRPPKRTGLNEMKGKLASKSYDPKTIRMAVDGGYSVEFSYDIKTELHNSGEMVKMDDLEYGDELIVRYMGKDLYALEIDRVRKAPRPQ